MISARENLISVGECLPRRLLAPAASSAPDSWYDGRHAVVLFVAHARPCPGCERYLGALADVVEDLGRWATRVYPIVADPGGVARARLGLGIHDAAVVVADRWGAAYGVTAAGDDHGLPEPASLVDLAKLIDIQCPECGVPSDEWRQCSTLPMG